MNKLEWLIVYLFVALMVAIIYMNTKINPSNMSREREIVAIDRDGRAVFRR